jgi:hypothetical protein
MGGLNLTGQSAIRNTCAVVLMNSPPPQTDAAKVRLRRGSGR